jgi:DNA polymerase-1
MSDYHRQVGKTANFSIVYAGGKPTIKRQLTRGGWEVDDKLAKQILDAVRATMPEVKALEAEIHARLDERGYITTLWGRHLHPNIEKYGKRDAYRRMLNSLFQGCAADLLRNGLREIAKGLETRGLQSHMVNNVHDEVTIDAKEEELSVLAECVPQWMGYDVVQTVLPITTSMEISYTNWADKEVFVA